ncbi:MAG: FtsX-like permease family protein, partial [Pseudomonadota bacterium]
VFRKPLRAVLTLGSLVVAFFLFGLLQSVDHAFSAAASSDAAERLITTARYSIIDDLPISHLTQIRAVDGVASATHSTWFGGVYQERRNFFAKFPVDASEYLTMYEEAIISPEAKRAFANSRSGVLVTSDIAERFEWDVGDRIPIIGDIYRTQDGEPWQFDLVGTFDWPEDSNSGSVMLINYDYFDEQRQQRGLVGWFITRVEDPSRAEEVAAAIDALFLNSENETKTSTEQEFQLSFARQIGNIGLIVKAILGAVFFTILIITGNTMSQAIRERTSELAVLKTLGFTNAAVLTLVLAEALMLCVLGGGLGLALAAAIEPVLAAVAPFPGIALTTNSLLAGLGLIVALAIVVGLPSGLRAMRLSIVDALGGR